MDEGTVTFWLSVPDEPDWVASPRGANFPAMSEPPIALSATKHPDGTLQMGFEGPWPKPLFFRPSLAGVSGPRIMIALTWANGTATLYINGESVETREIAR